MKENMANSLRRATMLEAYIEIDSDLPNIGNKKERKNDKIHRE
ncbi:MULTISPECIES: hypothetical protein [Lysinibacillus]|nr:MULTISPECIES: hypothetical protein [Lysinibacillus]